jgi:hypothetical protein
MIDLYFPNLGNIAHFLGKIRINLRDLRKNIFGFYARREMAVMVRGWRRWEGNDVWRACVAMVTGGWWVVTMTGDGGCSKTWPLISGSAGVG